MYKTYVCDNDVIHREGNIILYSRYSGNQIKPLLGISATEKILILNKSIPVLWISIILDFNPTLYKHRVKIHIYSWTQNIFCGNFIKARYVLLTEINLIIFIWFQGLVYVILSKPIRFWLPLKCCSFLLHIFILGICKWFWFL